MNNTVGSKIKQHRIKLNLTQQQLADRLSVSRQTIASYESGRTEPDIEMINKLSEIFKITTDELLGKEQDQKNDKKFNKAGLAVGITLNAIMFVRNMLFYIRERFFYVEPGPVAEEMQKTLEIRFAIYDVINLIDRYFPAIFVIGVFLIILSTMKSEKTHKFINLLGIVLIIVMSFVINIEFSIFINPNGGLWRGNYYDIMRQMFWDNKELVITLISLAIAGGVYVLINKFIKNRKIEQ